MNSGLHAIALRRDAGGKGAAPVLLGGADPRREGVALSATSTAVK
jgi:hypothetical protein